MTKSYPIGFTLNELRVMQQSLETLIAPETGADKRVLNQARNKLREALAYNLKQEELLAKHMVLSE